MFTKEKLEVLVCAKDRDELISAVRQIPEDELRTALILAVTLYKQSTRLEQELWDKEHKRCAELEAELATLKNG